MGSTTSCLADNTCIPCQGGVPPLINEEVKKLLEELRGGCSNFIEPMGFANKIVEIAEREGHHPDLKIAWGKCVVEIWPHKVEGLTESDFILAAKIEAIYVKR